MRKSLLDDPKKLLWLVIILGTAMRILFAGLVSYGYGEGYYIATARHLALSYFDQPPLSLWMAWATIKITGTTDPVIIRLPWIAMFAVTTWAMYNLGRELYNERAGAYAALLLNLSPVFTLSVGGWIQPDGPLMMFLLLATVQMVRILRGQPERPIVNWLLAGLFFGLALASKYHAALTLVGLFIYVLYRPVTRKRFFVPGLAVAAIVVAVLTAPTLIWNAQHGWASFTFQGTRVTEYTGIHPEWLLRSLFGQAFLIGLPIWPFIMHAWWKETRTGNVDTIFLTCLAFLPVVIFTVAALWAPFEYHFHWQAPGYLFVLPILAARLAKQREEGSDWPRRLFAIIAIFFGFLATLFAVQGATGFIGKTMPQSIIDKVPEAQNPLKELTPWPEIKLALEEKGLLNRDKLFVTVDPWHQIGKMDLQVGDSLPVICLCQDPRNPAFLINHRNMVGWDALIVGADRYVVDIEARYAPYFTSIEKIDRVDIHFKGQLETAINIYLAKNYNGQYPLPTDALGID